MSTINEFARHNINPLIEKYESARRRGDLATMGELYTDLDGEIKSAEEIFPRATKDIASLKNLQTKLWSELSERRVEHLVVTGKNAHPELVKDLAPVGIPNGGANCWANAIIQLIANAPGLARQVLGRRNNAACKELAPLIQNYYETQLSAKGVARDVNSQTLRRSLGNVPRSVFAQVDASMGLQGIFGMIGFQYDLHEEYHTELGAGYEDFIEEGTRKEPLIQLNMASKGRTFKDLFASFFSAQADDGRKIKTTFEKAPNDLVIQAQRTGQARNSPIEGIPEQFQLPSEYTRWNETAHYEITGCMIHLGEDNRGHYIALEKKADGWYLANDTNVSKVSNEEATRLLGQGYVFHYRKVEPKSWLEKHAIKVALTAAAFFAYYFLT